MLSSEQSSRGFLVFICFDFAFVGFSGILLAGVSVLTCVKVLVLDFADFDKALGFAVWDRSDRTVCLLRLHRFWGPEKL
jgi:hypothetical protein